MISVFIVEDEPQLLQGIKNIIEKCNSNFQVIGTASNGKNAMEKLSKLSPDVIFTDIRMPVMDGLTLIEKLKQNDSKAMIVILSGYQEFDYARKAMQFGVQEYLLKPISKSTMGKLLEEIFLKVTTTKKNRQVEILQSFLDHPSLQNTISAEEQHYFPYTTYHFMLVCSGSYNTFPYYWVTPAVDFWIQHDLESLFQEQVNPLDAFWVLSREQGNEKMIIIASDSNNKEYYKKAFSKIHSKLSEGGFPITSIDVLSSTLENIWPMIQNAKLHLNRSVVFASSKIFFLENVRNENSLHSNSFVRIENEKTLGIMIENRQFQKLKSEIKKFLDLCSRNLCSQLNLERILKEMIGFLCKYTDITNKDILSEADLRVNELISTSFSYKSLYEGFCFILDDLIDSPNYGDYINQEELANILEEYIKNNYIKKINHQTLAEKFHLVAPYLSQIYKKHKGMTPNEHILKLRIEKAEELLLIEPPINLPEIAEAIGFNDRFYLSKVFKAVIGKSPLEYRAEKLKLYKL